MTGADGRHPNPMRNLHFGTLGLLVLFAIAIGFQTAADPEPPPDRNLTWVVAILAFTVIAGRLMGRSPVAGEPTRRAAGLVSLGSALGIGAIAFHLASSQGAVTTGLGFVAGALVLSLRAPYAAAPPSGPTAPPGTPTGTGTPIG